MRKEGKPQEHIRLTAPRCLICSQQHIQYLLGNKPETTSLNSDMPTTCMNLKTSALPLSYRASRASKLRGGSATRVLVLYNAHVVAQQPKGPRCPDWI